MGEPAIAVEIRSLVVGYGAVDAVRGVDLKLKNGRIAALLGPSGCGKTTLLRSIAGFERPASGEVRLAGEVASGGAVWVEPEDRRIGMVFQDGALFPHLTVFDNVLYGVRGRAQASDRVREVLSQVGLDDLGERFPDQLSGGQQQRVALARALAPRPRIVLLDEPFANLDASLRAHVRQEVRSILQSAGITAILVTHDQEEALSFADEVVLMLRGEVPQVGTPEEVYRRPASPEVARFLGHGHLVPCTVASGRFRSSFGEASCGAKDGPGRVFLRPEDLALSSATEDDGVSATVRSRRFYGHDVLDTVQLSDGQVIEVRSLSSMTTPVGSQVRLRLRDREYRVFVDDSES